jgi:CBS domain-containing protein
MNKQTEKFLEAFNKLESWLRQQTASDTYIKFAQLVDICSTTNSVVETHCNYLKSLGNLRNAIVHGRSFPTTILATPEPTVVEDFNAICEEIYKPDTVYKIAAKQIAPYPKEEYLHKALRAMGTHDYSQVIVQVTDDEFGLITREGITKWIEANFKEEIVNLKDVTLADIFALEDINTWDYIARKQSVYDASTRFGNNERRIQALLVTENGRKNERPLGLITFWDIARYFGDKRYPVL